MDVKPNFFLPGTQKSGTTTLFELLSQHPQCYIPAIKTPEFFCRKDYESSLAEYCSFYEPARGKAYKAIGDLSQGYYYHEDAPKRIVKTLGKDVKLMFIYREPVGRAISAYWQLFKIHVAGSFKFLEERTLEEVFSIQTNSSAELLQVERSKLDQAIQEGSIVPDQFNSPYEEQLFPFFYLRNGFYAKYLKNYLTEFSKDQMLFICLEEFRNNPEKGLREIFSFLELDETFQPEGLHEVYHKTILPKRTPMMRGLHFAMPYVNHYLGKSKWLNDWYNQHSFYNKPKDPKHLVDLLRNYYAEDVNELTNLTGKNFQAIWKY